MPNHQNFLTDCFGDRNSLSFALEATRSPLMKTSYNFIFIKKLTSFVKPKLTIVEVAVATRKKPFRYSEPVCGMASDAVDAIRSASPTGFNSLELKMLILGQNKKGP